MFDETVTTMEVMEILVKVYDRLEALSDSMDRRFAAVEERLDRIEGRLDRVEARLDKVEQQLNYHTTWLNRIEDNMATTTQLNRLVRVLRHNGVISAFDASHVIVQG